MNIPKYPYLLCLTLFLLGYHTYGHAQEAIPKDGFISLKGGAYPLGEENIPITLSSFAISPTEVTYGQMSLFALQYGKDPERYHWIGRDRTEKPDAERPAVWVDWFDAIRYANWLSVQNGLSLVYTIYGDGGVLNPENESYWDDKSWTRVDSDISKKGYRLPTEAEWEYAAPGYEALGRKQEYFGTDDRDSLKEYAWYNENSGGEAHKPALLKPNANGIYDMGGNVWEWCFDEYKGDVFAGFKNQKNPFFQSDKRPYETFRSLRGGSFYYSIFSCRVPYRQSNSASHLDLSGSGFRLVRTL